MPLRKNSTIQLIRELMGQTAPDIYEPCSLDSDEASEVIKMHDSSYDC